MNKFEAAIVRRFGNPANFMREIGLPVRMAFDAAEGGGEAPGEEKSAVELIANLIGNLDPSEAAEVGEFLRGLVSDKRGIQRAAKDCLERGGDNKYSEEVGDRRRARDARPRLGRDEPLDFEPKPGEEGDRRRMAGDMAFDAWFPGAARIGRT
jgi:hypothetical protein